MPMFVLVPSIGKLCLATAVVLLMSTAAHGTLSEQSRWALGVSLRDADTSSLWRIGPRFAYGLTLGTNVFTHISDWRLWTLDLDFRLTAKVFHHRTTEMSWFTFLEPGLFFHEVDNPSDSIIDSETEGFAPDKSTTRLAAGTGIAWVPHKRLGCLCGGESCFNTEKTGIARTSLGSSWTESGLPDFGYFRV